MNSQRATPRGPSMATIFYRDGRLCWQKMTIPAMPIVAMLAVQYRLAGAMAASSVFFSVIGSVITLAVFILLTS
jgi:hypothetical protein